MTTVYLLPCACGEKLRIDSSQAGLAVRCRCGLDVKAPTFRDLSRLEQVEEASTARPQQEWGARHRLVLGGAVIATIGLVIAGFFWYTTPPYTPRITLDPRFPKVIAAEVAALSAEKLIETWEKIAEEGLDRSEPPNLDLYRREFTRKRGFTYSGLAIAAIGGLLMASSLFVGKGKSKGAPARAAH